MRRSLLAAIVLVGLALRPPGAEAGDPAVEVRVFPVGVITHGRIEFDSTSEKGYFPVPSDQVNDEENPLFGGEGAPTRRIFGTIDDVIELVKAHAPVEFSREGTSIAPVGTRRVVVKAPRATQELVARVLADFERAALRTVTIDVVAVRGDARAVDEGGFAAALARGELVALAGARASGGVASLISARIGSDLAYVQDQDVEVAQESYLSDPIVSLLKGGLSWRADVNAVVGDRIAVRFEGWWAEPGAPQRISLPRNGEPVERITAKAVRGLGQLDLRRGQWTLLETAGDVSFALRPTVRDDEGTIPAPAVSGAGFPASVEGASVSRTIDVRDLTVRGLSRRGRDRRLGISNYTPPEPPELAEGFVRLSAEELIARIRDEDPSLAELEGHALREQGGFLEVRAPIGHVEAIERLVAWERRRVTRAVRIRGTVVSLPVASMPEYLAGLDDGVTLVADGGRALLARAGARVVDRASVLVSDEARFVSDGGRLRSYVCDYDVEIAVGAHIGNPIVRDVLEGFRFEIDASLGAEPGALYAEILLDRAIWRGSRVVPTPSGEIECPTIGISRIRGGTCVRVGEPCIVGATLEDGVVTLTILGASFE